MTKKLKTALQFSFFLLLTAFLLWFAFRKADMGELWHGIKTANYAWILLGVLVGIAAYFIRAQRWRLLIYPLGFKPKLFAMFNAVILGYFVNLLFPRLGEVARCGALTKSDKIPFDKLVGTVVVERLFDAICLLLILVVTFFIRIESFGKFLQENVLQRLSSMHYLSIILIVLLVLLVLSAVAIILLWRNREKLRKYSFAQKIWNFLKGIGDGLKTVVHMKHRAQFLLHTLLLWVAYWIMAWVVLYSVPLAVHLGPVDGLVVMLLGSLGIILPTNGGLGAYHAITSIGMFAIFGIPESEGLLYATLSHESQMLFVIILGLIAYAWIFLFSKKEKVAA